MATPLTHGQFFLFALALWYEFPALSIGLSVLPPPAQIPTIPLQDDGIVFLAPDGSLTLVCFLLSECPMMTEVVPEALANDPLSPVLHSRLETKVPSGIDLIGRMFPTLREALVPAKIYWPEYIPSTAMKCSVLVLYLYGSLNWTLASGAPLPGSW